MADVSSIRLTISAMCRAAFVHPARVADQVFKVNLYLDLEGNEFDEERMEELNVEVQGMLDEWQAERARLRAARVGGGGKVQLEVDFCDV